MRDFSLEAATYDSVPARVKMASDIADTILDTVAVTKEMDVLDFGCGTGLVSVRLHGQVRSVTSADNAPGMLETLEAKVHANGIENIRPCTWTLLPARDLKDATT